MKRIFFKRQAALNKIPKILMNVTVRIMTN